MRFDSLENFLDSGAAAGLRPGPLAVIFAEDAVELTSTARHHEQRGFAAVLLMLPRGLALPPELDGRPALHPITCATMEVGCVPRVMNRLIAALPGRWFYWGYNGEYLFYPFSETRPPAAMLAFHEEERREAMQAYVIDLYAADLGAHPSGVDTATAHLDRLGYFAEARPDPNGRPKERQLDFQGGLRWRFEEHVPPRSRSIGRIALFRAKPGLTMRGDFSLSDEEMNTYACPWHHNLTAAVCSFRAAKALRANAGSRFAIDSFMWHGATPFEWRAQQLLELGMMEPGQWF
ncbi:hypothetical protein C2I36_09115 [Rhodobacteraceae bacterium WD3A24]|nr:hypothetical protein C2I36_09115 [Rhodobacteraceae bacterium WD3A24]